MLSKLFKSSKGGVKASPSKNSKVIHGSTTCSFTELADRDLFIGERILDLVERTAHYITSKLVGLHQI